MRTDYRRSTLEITDPEVIINVGARLIQDYVTEIEERFQKAVHILLMGGKDSENIILAKRKRPWIVVSGETNAPLNNKFVERNSIEIDRYIGCPDTTDDRFLLEEILASDCFYDVADIRYLPLLEKLTREHSGEVVIWMGTSGDGIFSRNTNQEDLDYYAVHDLLVGIGFGIYHQTIKNMLNVPVVSPYQSPRMLDELFYRFDPYFVDVAGDVRADIGQALFGQPVIYPSKNTGPGPMTRSRRFSLPIYTKALRDTGVAYRGCEFASYRYGQKERVKNFFNEHSAKRRTSLSRLLFPTRKLLSRFVPFVANNRFNVSVREIR